MTGPKEALQSVSAAAGNHVNVEMGNRLPDAVVDRNKGPIRFDGRFNRFCQQLNLLKQGPNGARRKIRQRDSMRFRRDQNVSGKQRVYVQESDCLFVFKNAVTRNVALDNFAKEARRIEGAHARAHFPNTQSRRRWKGNVRQ